MTTAAFSQHDAIGDVLDRGEFVVADRLGVGDVETQAIGRDERTLLRNVIAEHLAQRLVQQMGRRVIGADRGARRVIDLELQRGADIQRPLLDLDLVNDEIAELFLVSTTRTLRPGARTRPTSPT